MAGMMLLFLVLENIQRLPVASGSAGVFKRASRRIFLNQFTGGTEFDNIYFLRFHAIFFLIFHAIFLSVICSIALEWRNAHADETGEAGPRYRVRHVWGDGAHSDAHGGMLLPEVLRWIWGTSP